MANQGVFYNKQRNGVLTNCSNDVLVNTGIWDPINWRAHLEAHKATIRASAQEETVEPIEAHQPKQTTDAHNYGDTLVASNMALGSYKQQATPQSAPVVYSTRSAPVVHSPQTTIVPYASQTADASCAPSYQGDPYLALNRPAAIDKHENVRVWVTGLPPFVTTHELLGAIQGLGAVFASHINPPLAPKGENDYRLEVFTSAASITFFTTKAANRLLQQPLVVGGYQTQVRPHRVKTAPIHARDGRSRVLIISGDPCVVNLENLERLAAETWDIQYDTDTMRYEPGDQRSLVVWAFGSFRAQAHAVYLMIQRHLAGQVTVSYGIDPCSLED
ncbi:hypothetical protein F5Y19DRAFT_486620 [Xylariaceae sp. FL1651]|nr:hypothetical protein F5Y19DRAFT_486620 [Xylariaceae sp. FL1651]